MDAVEKNLGKQPEGTRGALEDQKDLLKTIMERTERLEAETPNEASPDMIKLTEEMRKLEEQQKEYQDWKKTFSDNLDRKIDNLVLHGERMDAQMKTTNENMAQLINSIAQIGKRCKESATIAQVTTITASQQMLTLDVAKLCARVEQMERAGKPNRPTEPPDNSRSGERSLSPPAESHKKRQKNFDPVCNTPNVIKGSQDSNTIIRKQKELHPRCGQMAD
eukprot:8019170-Ditylum_brightwellii.AAC.1